jgi:hypothetical protein
MYAQIQYKIITLKTYNMDFQKNASILTIKMFIYMGSFIVGVPKKGKGTPKLLWGYFLQIKFT